MDIIGALEQYQKEMKEFSEGMIFYPNGTIRIGKMPVLDIEAIKQELQIKWKRPMSLDALHTKCLEQISENIGVPQPIFDPHQVANAYRNLGINGISAFKMWAVMDGDAPEVKAESVTAQHMFEDAPFGMNSLGMARLKDKFGVDSDEVKQAEAVWRDSYHASIPITAEQLFGALADPLGGRGFVHPHAKAFEGIIKLNADWMAEVEKPPEDVMSMTRKFLR